MMRASIFRRTPLITLVNHRFFTVDGQKINRLADDFRRGIAGDIFHPAIRIPVYAVLNNQYAFIGLFDESFVAEFAFP